MSSKKSLANVNIEQYAVLLGYGAEAKNYKWNVYLYPTAGWPGNSLPMIWAGGDSYKAAALQMINHNYTGRILLPNEPDLTDQANMTPGGVVVLQNWTMNNFPSATIVAPNVSDGDPRTVGAGNSDPRLNGNAPWFRKWHKKIQERANAQDIYDNIAAYGIHWYQHPGWDHNYWTPTRLLDIMSEVLVVMGAPVKKFWITETSTENEPDIFWTWLNEFTADERVDEVFVFGTKKPDPENPPGHDMHALVEWDGVPGGDAWLTPMGKAVRNWAG